MEAFHREVELVYDPDPTRLIDWVGINWAQTRDGEEVWVQKSSGNFEAIGPFEIVSVFDRKLGTLDGGEVVFTHPQENLLVPRTP